jgi:hypothetical protein
VVVTVDSLTKGNDTPIRLATNQPQPRAILMGRRGSYLPLYAIEIVSISGTGEEVYARPYPLYRPVYTGRDAYTVCRVGKGSGIA